MPAKTISVRLDPVDVRRLAAEAEKLGVSPGTFARVLIKSGLDDSQKLPTYSRAARLRALDKRVLATWPTVGEHLDGVVLAREARDELERRSG